MVVFHLFLFKNQSIKIKSFGLFYIEHLDNKLDDKFFHPLSSHLLNAILLDYHQKNFQMDHDIHNNAKNKTNSFILK